MSIYNKMIVRVNPHEPLSWHIMLDSTAVLECEARGLSISGLRFAIWIGFLVHEGICKCPYCRGFGKLQLYKYWTSGRGRTAIHGKEPINKYKECIQCLGNGYRCIWSPQRPYQRPLHERLRTWRNLEWGIVSTNIDKKSE